MKFNISLNIKSIIRTEQFLKKPFGEIDYTDESDLKAMLYCVVLCNNNIQSTYEEFLNLNEKLFAEMIKEFEKNSKILAQFQSESKSNNDNVKPSFLGDLAAMLILEGIDANYVLNEMQLSDLTMYIEAYERKKKEQMESSRLWTYFSILPHVDGKKLKSPVDLYPFPWELEGIEERAKEALTKGEDTLDKFLNGEIKLK